MTFRSAGSQTAGRTDTIRTVGSREDDKVSGFFVLSHLRMRGYFRLG